MRDILSEIVESKRAELAESRRMLPESELRAQALASPVSPRSMSSALASSASGIIAEFKRRSPSKGWIHAGVAPEDVVPQYQKNGATALSILTDEPYFGGSLDFISRVRGLVDIPILRKDFIISGYQLLQARLAGADAVLLIAACLSPEQCSDLAAEAHELGLEVLLELHSPEEIRYMACGADMVGVNNRNLGSFHTDVKNSYDMMPLLREGAVKYGTTGSVFVSESGISFTMTVRQLRSIGFRGFLMGENFMKHDNPGEALAAFLGDL